MSLIPFGRLFIAIGLGLAFVGVLLLIAGRLGGGLLPGDLLLRRGRVTFFFPLATSLLISLILSIVLTLLARWRR